MSDRNAELLAAEREERIRVYEAGIAAYHAQNLDEPPSPESKRVAIANCGLCDRDGYRGMQVCDHDPNHAAAAARGKAACLAEIARAKDGGE